MVNAPRELALRTRPTLPDEYIETHNNTDKVFKKHVAASEFAAISRLLWKLGVTVLLSNREVRK